MRNGSHCTQTWQIGKSPDLKREARPSAGEPHPICLQNYSCENVELASIDAKQREFDGAVSAFESDLNMDGEKWTEEQRHLTESPLVGKLTSDILHPRTVSGKQIRPNLGICIAFQIPALTTGK